MTSASRLLSETGRTAWTIFSNGDLSTRTGRNFWEEKAHVLRDSLIAIATDSEGLLPERYSELESISIEFPKLHLELKGDEVFTYENFDASFRVFGFLVLQYGVIDYDQICETYKAEVAGVLKAIRETVTRRHVKEFDSFASRLLQTIHTNIELYNPEIIELIKQLDSERTRLDDLERRARGLEGCRQSISSLIDWRR